ncbi:4-hydroxybenzoate octaprenyltransferase [Thermithiobacillus plumbiphilus]|uniref:4-hydroxybenzoate octaprenyltransferase n=1 Tax=Thermithiobacillus plumbiphilus TaxID=1729899 RepID=A0ABU9D8K3_9PROT
MSKIRDYLELMRMHRPIGTLLLLWPTYWALFLAGRGHPDPLLVLVFGLGVLLMRSAGCVINDYADRDFDAHVARTRDRPLASGRVSPREALGLFVVLVLISASLLLFLNWLTIALAVIALLLAATYPFFKRFTHLPQAYLGIAFGWGIPMAFAAQTGQVPNLAWLLLAANIAWVLAYDTAYAMADRPDDLKIGVKSTAILFGRFDRLMIALLHGLALGLLYWVGRQAGLSWPFDLSLLLAAGLALYEQWLIRDRDRLRSFQAFLHNNWIGMTVFAGILGGLYIPA